MRTSDFQRLETPVEVDTEVTCRLMGGRGDTEGAEDMMIDLDLREGKMKAPAVLCQNGNWRWRWNRNEISVNLG